MSTKCPEDRADVVCVAIIVLVLVGGLAAIFAFAGWQAGVLMLGGCVALFLIETWVARWVQTGRWFR